MRRLSLALALLAVVALAPPVRAQLPGQYGNLSVGIWNPQYYSRVGFAQVGTAVPVIVAAFDSTSVGDSTPTRTIFRSATLAGGGGGLYGVNISLTLHDSGTVGGFTPSITCGNGVARQTFTGSRLADSLSPGLEVESVLPCYIAAGDSITFKVAKASITGTPHYNVHVRIRYGP